MKTGQRKFHPIPAAISFLLTALVGSAQTQQPAQTADASLADTGSVVGRVVIEGTNQPVSLAEIRLVPERPVAPPDQQEKRTGPYNIPKPHLTMVNGLALLDGKFRMEGVPAGDYFAGAIFPGFVGPYLVAGADATDDQLKVLMPSMPTVHVAAGQVAHIDLRLHHGAVISGNVRYADGRPATGLAVEWEIAEQNLARKSVRLARPSALQEVVQRFDFYTMHRREVTTDDRGMYRIYGLPPGHYIVSTALPQRVDAGSQILMSDGSSPSPDRPGSAMSSIPIITPVYCPGVFRRSEGKVYQVRGSEQVLNADLKIDLRGLLSVRGSVIAGPDHHVPAQAILRLQEDSGDDVGKLAAIDERGSFQFDYIPPGKYTLQLMGAEDPTPPTGPGGTSQTVHRYKLAKIPVVVKDRNVELGTIMLTALKPGEVEQYPE